MLLVFLISGINTDFIYLWIYSASLCLGPFCGSLFTSFCTMCQTASPSHSCARRVLGLFTDWVFKCFLLDCRTSSVARVLPQEPSDQTGITINMPDVELFFFLKPLLTRYGPVKWLSTKLHQSCGQYNVNQGSESLCDWRVWLTDRRGKAAAAWRWLAPGRGFLKWAWCLPTCLLAPCPSPSAGRSFWTTAALHPPRPARSL